MKTKRYITYFLFLVSMIMLTIPVIPHHHHGGNELLCMKSDIQSDCCEHHRHSSTENHEHCCCNTGCVTTHFVQKVPSTQHSIPNLHSTLWQMTLFYEPILRLLLLPDAQRQRQHSIYIESLHGTFITRATGLRAPPSVFA